jgi:signal transduction histidine kinase
VISVTDDGRGLQAPRPTSHGLSIMRERALLINAALDLAEPEGGGLTVTVRIPASLAPVAHEPRSGRAKIGA